MYDSGRVTDPSLVVISLASRHSWDKKIRMVRKTTMYVVICTTVVAITVHVGAEVRDRDTQNVKIAGEAWHWPNASCAVWVIFFVFDHLGLCACEHITVYVAVHS